MKRNPITNPFFKPLDGLKKEDAELVTVFHTNNGPGKVVSFLDINLR